MPRPGGARAGVIVMIILVTLVVWTGPGAGCGSRWWGADVATGVCGVPGTCTAGAAGGGWACGCGCARAWGVWMDVRGACGWMAAAAAGVGVVATVDAAGAAGGARGGAAGVAALVARGRRRRRQRARRGGGRARGAPRMAAAAAQASHPVWARHADGARGDASASLAPPCAARGAVIPRRGKPGVILPGPSPGSLAVVAALPTRCGRLQAGAVRACTVYVSLPQARRPGLQASAHPDARACPCRRAQAPGVRNMTEKSESRRRHHQGYPTGRRRVHASLPVDLFRQACQNRVP